MDAPEPGWTDQANVDAACLQSALYARAQLLSELNSLLRRFRQYATETEWVRLVLEGAGAFADELALFVLDNGILHLRGQINLALAGALSFPLAGAAAFESVCATKDPVTALRNPSEVTDFLSVPATIGRAHLLPIMNGQRVAAILFAAGSVDPDLNGLEFITGLASSVLERPSNAARHAQIAVLEQPPAAALVVEQRPHSDMTRHLNLAVLSEKDRQLHIRARRFSRSALAELQLSKPDVCRAAREQSTIYGLLAKEIDRSREIYRRQFMTIPSMTDYFHMELVQTVAEGNASKLGADYPGPLL